KRSTHSRIAALNRAFCGLLACLAIEGQATTYVFRTDSLPFSNQELNAIGATYGLSTSGYVFSVPSWLPYKVNPINGTPVRWVGFRSSGGLDTASDTAVFAVDGDLNLSTNDQILALGPNFLWLEVAGDVTIPVGAKISAQAFGIVPGAGGGAGGLSV